MRKPIFPKRSQLLRNPVRPITTMPLLSTLWAIRKKRDNISWRRPIWPPVIKRYGILLPSINTGIHRAKKCLRNTARPPLVRRSAADLGKTCAKRGFGYDEGHRGRGPGTGACASGPTRQARHTEKLQGEANRALLLSQR